MADLELLRRMARRTRDDWNNSIVNVERATAQRDNLFRELQRLETEIARTERMNLRPEEEA